MNTTKTHQRFWDAMRARFGVRWITEQGDAPSAPWVQMLNGYPPAQVLLALDLMVEQKLAHPPTLPQFEALLKRAALKAPSDVPDYVRGYWRTCIVGHCIQQLQQDSPGFEPEDFEQYLIANRQTLGGSLRVLLDELCDMEARNQGQRTLGLVTRCRDRSLEILRAYQQPLLGAVSA